MRAHGKSSDMERNEHFLAPIPALCAPAGRGRLLLCELSPG